MLFDTLLEDYSALNKEHSEEPGVDTEVAGANDEGPESKAKTKVSPDLFMLSLLTDLIQSFQITEIPSSNYRNTSMPTESLVIKTKVIMSCQETHFNVVYYLCMCVVTILAWVWGSVCNS